MVGRLSAESAPPVNKPSRTMSVRALNWLVGPGLETYTDVIMLTTILIPRIAALFGGCLVTSFTA